MPAHANYHLNHDAFEPPLSIMAEYWIGFLLADGGISKYVLQLTLRAPDRAHLEKFATFMEAEAPIYEVPKRNCVTIRLMSTRLCSSLQQWGILPRKSLRQVADSRLVTNLHFWRGLIDGNGYVAEDRVEFGGGETIVSQWRDFCLFLKVKRTPRVNSTPTNRAYFRSAVHGPSMRTVIRALYEDAPPAARLDRKYEKAIQILSWQPKSTVRAGDHA